MGWNFNRSPRRLECCIGQGFDWRSRQNFLGNVPTSWVQIGATIQIISDLRMIYKYRDAAGMSLRLEFFRVFPVISLTAVHRKDYLFSNVYHSSTKLLWHERFLFVCKYTFDITSRYLFFERFSVLISQSLFHFN